MKPEDVAKMDQQHMDREKIVNTLVQQQKFNRIIHAEMSEPEKVFRLAEPLRDCTDLALACDLLATAINRLAKQ